MIILDITRNFIQQLLNIYSQQDGAVSNILKKSVHGHGEITYLFCRMTFDGRPNTAIAPRYSRCSTPTCTDADKEKVKELKAWALSVGIVEPSIYVTLADLTGNLYFDLLCQVVHADSEQNVLHVWDGTEPSFEGLLFIFHLICMYLITYLSIDLIHLLYLIHLLQSLFFMLSTY